VQLDRQEARQALITYLRPAASGPTGLVGHVVTGEPDVGKSALSLCAASQLAEAGTPVTILSLRELPATVLELEALLGASLTDVLGATATGAGRLLLVDGAEAALEGRGRFSLRWHPRRCVQA
jgi:Mrp family chromosome partitioning ATPase